MKNCCETFIKYIFVIVNILFLVIGLTLIALGIYIQEEENTYAEFLGEGNDIGATSPIFFTIVGGVIFIVALFGCCGACHENYCMMYTHAILLTFIIILEIAVVVVAHAMSEKIEMELKKSMADGMKNYNETGFEKATETWDFIQENVHCCGIANITDWKKKGKAIPDSCCLRNNLSECGVDDNEGKFTIGCLDQVMVKFNENFTMIGACGILIILLQFTGVIFACCIGKSMKHSGEYV